MAFPFGTNCTFDIYRGFNAANPYAPPNIPAAISSVPGYVRQHVRNGRFGVYLADNDQNPLYWTTILNMPVGTDLRDPYNSQLVAPVIKTGDTIMMYDYPIAGTCTAFLVVFVQQRSRGTPDSYLRIYLDRCRPSYGFTCLSGIPTLCCPNGWPNTLYATVSVISGTCPCVAGSFPLTWNGNTESPAWVAETSSSCGSFDYPIRMTFTCDNATTVEFSMECIEDGPGIFFADGTTTEFTCPPSLSASFSLTSVDGECCGVTEMNITVTQ